MKTGDERLSAMKDEWCSFQSSNSEAELNKCSSSTPPPRPRVQNNFHGTAVFKFNFSKTEKRFWGCDFHRKKW